MIVIRDNINIMFPIDRSFTKLFRFLTRHNNPRIVKKITPYLNNNYHRFINLRKIRISYRQHPESKNISKKPCLIYSITNTE